MTLFSSDEVLETIRMIEMEGLDIRTVTLAVSLQDCADPGLGDVCRKIERKILSVARGLIEACEEAQSLYGVPIINRRLAVTPISIVAAPVSAPSYVPIAQAMDEAARKVGVDFIGGFSALAHKGFTPSALRLLESIPEALAATDYVMSAVNVASTRTGINMDAVARMGHVIQKTAESTVDRSAVGCARLATFANLPEDVPFMPGAIHGFGQPEAVINIGVSGPGVVRSRLEKLGDADLGQISEEIKRTSFKIARVGELVGREVSRLLGVDFGIVDLSLAPTTAVGDSVAHILKLMGLEQCGTHGTTAALALLTDAVKKGGAMASSYVGGFSGAFIPVSEDAGMIEAVAQGALTLDKLEAMTSVCAVGLDMIIVPGDTPPETLSAIIADEMAIGVINHKTTSVRIAPVPGKHPGDWVRFEGHKGLLGEGSVMPVHRESSAAFIQRRGRIPAPITSLKN
ncbi:MAG: PFL family protein [Armatimonadetes bacterium]|nr:PFL family protein [Armatimonadota bacterium]